MTLACSSSNLSNLKNGVALPMSRLMKPTRRKTGPSCLASG
jgi:hypothetical protein